VYFSTTDGEFWRIMMKVLSHVVWSRGARPASQTRGDNNVRGTGKLQLSAVQQDMLCEQLTRKELSYYQPYTTFYANPLKPGQTRSL